MAAEHDNRPRFGDQPQGHVESWFLRANAPDARRAIWVKATVLRTEAGEESADAWCALFDGDAGWTCAARATVALSQASFTATGRSEIAGCTLSPGPNGSARGLLDATGTPLRWDLRWTALPRLGEPLCPVFTRRLIEGPFPRSKLLTPVPAARFEGSASRGDERWDLSGWTGMQGHNWGREHAYEYAWGQCLFPGADGAPHAMVEGFSGRLRLGGHVTPPFSALVVRRGEREYRFDRLYDLWRQRPELGDLHWSLQVRGAAGTAELRMEAKAAEMVCLGYRNPDGALSYCLNSKLARTILRVSPVNEDAFSCTSEAGGALEFLRRTPDPRFPEVI